MKALASIIGLAALSAAASASAAPKESGLTSALFGESSSQPGRQHGGLISPTVRDVLPGLHKGWELGNGHSPEHGGGHCRGHRDDWCGPASP